MKYVFLAVFFISTAVHLYASLRKEARIRNVTKPFILLSLLGSVLFFLGVRQRRVDADTVTAKTVFSAAGIVTFIAISFIWLL
jgi:hypothetical protein